MKIFISHVGYSISTNKKAVLRESKTFSGTKFTIKCRESNEIKFSGNIVPAGSVDNWKDWYFYSMDFSDFNEEGRFYIDIDGYRSENFDIVPTIFDKNLHHEIICYFRANRSSSKWDRHDQNASFVGDRKDKVDVRGGWYDASGDYSKYFSHLNYANFMNPQQIPGSVWHMLKFRENIIKREHPTAKFIQRIEEEATFGADFLVRMFDKNGYFYTTLFDKWSKDPNQREICSYETMAGNKYDNYQAGFRQGAGLAIASLAKASTTNDQYSEFGSKKYLEIAINAYDHLEMNNTKYLDNGKENIIDDYCSLIALVELFKATNNVAYKIKADKRARKLINRQTSDNVMRNWFIADDLDRPFFHGAEAGFPALSLIEYLEIADNKDEVKDIIKKSLEYELEVTNEVTNPFGYARQYTRDTNNVQKTSFFIPHNNETGYWWQGENARIASLAAAAYIGSLLFSDDKELSNKLVKYGNDQIHWIFGLNPFDTCMYYGRGRNIPEYDPGWPSVPGGICNGITSGFLDESDIDFRPESANTGNNTWRWGEQWIPHASWFLFASSIIE
ncbi:MAG: glycoside hydrolase family 9 protein [Spirochaetales bacterium]|nr:glycoside hydrolase family 9 protein [Spirochaetales bacterium]